jgi:hypothetical protein
MDEPASHRFPVVSPCQTPRSNLSCIAMGKVHSSLPESVSHRELSRWNHFSEGEQGVIPFPSLLAIYLSVSCHYYANDIVDCVTPSTRVTSATSENPFEKSFDRLVGFPCMAKRD